MNLPVALPTAGLTAGLTAGALTLAAALALRAGLDARRHSAVAQRLRGGGSAMDHGGLLRCLPDPPAPLVRRLAGTGVAWDAGQVWAGWLAAVAGALAAGWLAGGPGLAVVALAGAAAAPMLALHASAGRADSMLEEALPEALEAMAGALRSGASLRQAVDETATASPGLLGADLAAVAAEVDRGRILADALESWGQRRPLPGVRLAVSALALGAETGGAHARAIDGVAATVRSRLAVGREVRALSSQARLSGVVITLAPLGFSALAIATDERTADFLLRTPLGLLCLGAGLALDAAAALWMLRLSRVDA